MLAFEEGCERKGSERNHEPTIYRSLGHWCGLGSRCRIGAGGPLQQQDRAIRKGRAAVRRKPWRGTDGAAIDWRSARSPTNAHLGQTGRRAGASIVQCGHGAGQAARCSRQSLGLHAGARRGQAHVQPAVIDSEGQSAGVHWGTTTMLRRLLLSGLVAVGVAAAAMPSATAQRFTEAVAAGAIGDANALSSRIRAYHRGPGRWAGLTPVPARYCPTTP